MSYESIYVAVRSAVIAKLQAILEDGVPLFQEVEYGPRATVDVATGAYVLPAPIESTIITIGESEEAFAFVINVVGTGSSEKLTHDRVVHLVGAVRDALMYGDCTLDGVVQNIHVARIEFTSGAEGLLEEHANVTVICRKTVTP